MNLGATIKGLQKMHFTILMCFVISLEGGLRRIQIEKADKTQHYGSALIICFERTSPAFHTTWHNIEYLSSLGTTH